MFVIKAFENIEVVLPGPGTRFAPKDAIRGFVPTAGLEFFTYDQKRLANGLIQLADLHAKVEYSEDANNDDILLFESVENAVLVKAFLAELTINGPNPPEFGYTPSQCYD